MLNLAMQVVDEMPVLLPGENRMTFDTFMHRNRGLRFFYPNPYPYPYPYLLPLPVP